MGLECNNISVQTKIAQLLEYLPIHFLSSCNPPQGSLLLDYQWLILYTSQRVFYRVVVIDGSYLIVIVDFSYEECHDKTVSYRLLKKSI